MQCLTLVLNITRQLSGVRRCIDGEMINYMEETLLAFASWNVIILPRVENDRRHFPLCVYWVVEALNTNFNYLCGFGAIFPNWPLLHQCIITKLCSISVLRSCFKKNDFEAKWQDYSMLDQSCLYHSNSIFNHGLVGLLILYERLKAHKIQMNDSRFN